MATDKEIKKDFKKKASKDPDMYYATDVLRKYGFIRRQCSCGIYYWTVNKDQMVCGDSACSGGFRLFENNPCRKALSYVEVWQQFSEMFKGLGYTPIDRYPVVARWNPTADFVMASIAAFQPYVVSGEVEPPAKRLVIPQFSIRFSDIENIGITASHNTGFVMIGQHMFVSPEEWDQDKVFEDIVKWLTDGLGLPFEEITFHEDAWAGGGNFGPCMEYFSRGVELGNQVYMLYEQTPNGSKELSIKVLDMGMGHERNAWFSQATPTQHQAVYPHVVDKILEQTGVKIDGDLMKRFIPLSGYLNIDEVNDIGIAWKRVADELTMDVNDLKEKILPLAGVFSIADHTRTLLFALSDGALPSNVGGCYNLRMLVRRALSFVDKYGWDIRLADVCKWHAKELKPIFPELEKSLDEVAKILDVERQKYEKSKENVKQIVSRIITKEVTEDKLLELYDTRGISPQLIIDEAAKQGIEIKMPPNFFGRVGELHEKNVQVHATSKEETLDLEGVSETKILYYDDYLYTAFEAKIVKKLGTDLVLDKTAFYPTSGGQLHDVGNLNGISVTDVFKQGAVVVHRLAEEIDAVEGDYIDGVIDIKRRKQLAQHHTSTHIVNTAAREILGKHINQAGAKKTAKKAHLDVTHFEALTDSILKKIEERANEIVKSDLEIKSFFMSRRDAEEKYGMVIYQGGAVPGKNIRIIEIGGIDAEACGGTHLHQTSEAGSIKILKSTKIQDGIVRITFTAGEAAQAAEKVAGTLISDAAALLSVEEAGVPARARELFKVWKGAKKAQKKGKEVPDTALTSTELSEGDLIAETAEILKTQPQHIVKTIKRFLEELKEMHEK